MSSYSHIFFIYPKRVDILIPDFRYFLCFVKNWFSPWYFNPWFSLFIFCWIIIMGQTTTDNLKSAKMFNNTDSHENWNKKNTRNRQNDSKLTFFHSPFMIQHNTSVNVIFYGKYLLHKVSVSLKSSLWIQPS